MITIHETSKMKTSLLRHIILLAAALLVGMATPVAAGEIQTADSAYSRGDYAAAVAEYTKVAEEQGISAELLYDLGNAYARGGDYGNAMASYLRALRLDPSSAKVRNNIEYIEQKVSETNHAELRGKKLSVERDLPSFFTSVRNYISRDHLSDTWAVWAAAAFVLFVACVAIYMFVRSVGIRKVGFFGAFVFLGVSVVALTFAFMAASYRSDEGVVTAPKVKLLSEASASSKESAVNLTRGTRMSILDTHPAGVDHPQWYKVRLNGDFVGWISEADFVAVE